MANYKCEEISMCENFHLAICLHCNRRLCLQHITEHHIIVFGGVQHLSNEVETTFQHIKEESEKSRSIYNNVLISFNEWRIQQMGKIQQIYENQLQLIKSQQETVNHVQQKLFEQLDRNARQPLEHIQRQKNASTEILNHIRQTIKNVREESTQLKWSSPTAPSINTEYSSSDFSPISIQLQLPTAGNIASIPKETPIKLPLTNVVTKYKGRLLQRFVQMFENISSIEQSKKDIDIYIKSQGRYFKLPILVCSYLTAWCSKLQTNEKVFLLNEHISTIHKYLKNRQSNFDVLVGIQVFFYNAEIRVNKSEMMRFLLQFFLNHQCISEDLVLDWYNSNDSHGQMGFEKAKQLAKPFIESLSTVSVDIEADNTQAISTSVEQCDTIEIKQEST